MIDSPRGSETAPSSATAWLTATACLAIALPPLIAFNVSPSATFFNQAAAYIGWGAFLIVVASLTARHAWPRSAGSRSLLAAMALLLLAALGASVFGKVPWSLSLSSAGTIASAMLAATIGASLPTALARRVFVAFCIGLVVAGIGSSIIGLLQVFAPTLPDGTWVAPTALPGRATGNLRQPNHLSSLLIWSVVAAVWLAESRRTKRAASTALVLVFLYVVVLTASRTGAVGMLTLAAWGLLDRRLSRPARLLLLLAPVLYGAMWWATSVWATQAHQPFAGQTRFGGEADISNARFPIWSNTLSLLASHPWLGVGFGDFNFAWTLTPFPGRPGAFFDHTHNLVLNFAVELGLPLAALVLALLCHALWVAIRNAHGAGRDPGEGVPVERAALLIVIAVAVHSMFEYPLWYSYFLLPTAFAFGLCLARPAPAGSAAAGQVRMEDGEVTRPYVIGAMLLVLFGTLAVYDYMRVVVIFAPPVGAGPLEARIANGRRSVLFGHHADYAAATVPEHPSEAMSAFERAPHYLLDPRLMIAWARALDERGESDKARYLAARLREFRTDQADEFFAPCDRAAQPPGAASAAQGGAPAPLPFQCLPPTRPLRFEDFY